MQTEKWLSFFTLSEDSLLPFVSQAFRTFFDNGGDIVKLNEALFGFHSSMTQKLTLSYILKDDGKINLALANRLYVFGTLCHFNRDLLFKEIPVFNIDVDVNEEQYPSNKFLDTLKNKYNEARLLRMFFHAPLYASEMEDLISMFKRMETKYSLSEALELLPDKPKNFMELHDALSASLDNFNMPNFFLNQREDICALEGSKLINGFVIKVPRTHYDLVRLGNALHFCIGNGEYSEKVKDGKISIVAIYKDAKPIYGIEFNRYTIKQAKGFGNQALSKELVEALEQSLIKPPTVPEEFIKIEHHKFICGYKYNNQDLYTILKNGLIYVYHNVPHEEYESFHESPHKGHFFATAIKPKYACTKQEKYA